MAAACIEHGLEVWAWCLMPNHVHLVVVPDAAEGLAVGIGRAHWRYTRAIHFRENWRGYLWQGRFSSCPMDGPHTLAAARYVERNPVRAGLVTQAWDWPWSSAAAHAAGRGDRLVKTGGPLAAEVADGRAFLVAEDGEEMLRRLRQHGRTGRPLGSPGFVLGFGYWCTGFRVARRPG
jgi:putative transposase